MTIRRFPNRITTNQTPNNPNTTDQATVCSPLDVIHIHLHTQMSSEASFSLHKSQTHLIPMKNSEDPEVVELWFGYVSY